MICAACGIIEPLRHPAGGKDAGIVLVTWHDVPRAPNRQIRVARQIVFGRKIMPCRGSILDSEPVAPIITMPAILRLTILRFETAITRSETKIPSVNVDAPPGAHRPNCPSAVSIGAVQPIVESIIESIGAVLLVAFAEAGKQRHMSIRASIAVGV